MPIVLDPIVSGIWRPYLVDVDGVVHSVGQGDDVALLTGAGGQLMPPIVMFDRELPLQDGSQLQGIRVGTREFDQPMLIEALSLAGLVNRHEHLLAWVNPKRGSVIWRWQRPDDTWRELPATYLGGLEGSEGPENGVETWWQGVATFRAHEPYWRDVDATTRIYALVTTPGTWFPLTFPITLAGSQVFQHTNELNDGTAEAWPVWTITGPGADPVLRNLTTGKYLGLTWTLLAGETLTVDMAPLVEVPIYDSGGNNRFQVRTTGSERWPLVVGNNLLQVEMAGATTASSVTMAYRRRWLRR